MNVDDFDFGEEDARALNLFTDDEKSNFVRSFVTPRNFKLKDFLSGRKFFVYGKKGAGKTALLQYIKLLAESEEANAICKFYYFQSSFKRSELEAFKKSVKHSGADEELVNDPDFSDIEEIPVFWRIFILLSLSQLFKDFHFHEGGIENFYKSVEAIKLISRSQNVGKKYPSLEKFQIQLSRDPRIEISGSFEGATVGDLHTYIEIAERTLEEFDFETQPIFLFFDELEVYRTSEGNADTQLIAVASLVKAVRDFNEKFRKNFIRVIAAVRSEVISEVTDVPGEVYRVISSNGVEIGWSDVATDTYHPLEEIVLRQIAAQDYDIKTESNHISKKSLSKAFEKYFEKDYSLRNALNLSWYRPRDIALIFEIAQGIDTGRSRFRSKTLSDKIVKKLGERMLVDAKSGLAYRYDPIEISAIDRISRAGKEQYSYKAFLERFNDLSHQFDDVGRLSDNRLDSLLEDLYRVGVLYAYEVTTGSKSFYFRNDEMPSFSQDWGVGVHQSLLKTLNISLKDSQK